MKAMIYLGLNCGFGCTDCAELKWKNIDFDKQRICLARGKTGINRNLPLWPDTIDALKRISRKTRRVFNTSKGNSFVRTISKYDPDGNERYIVINTVSTMFSRLVKKAGLKVPKGTGFYTLRRTAATMAARSGDPFAVQRLLGHADLKMASRYVQDVSKQTDRVVKSVRNLLI
jgi:integrase